MRTEDEIKREAGNLKLKLINRISIMKDLAEKIQVAEFGGYSKQPSPQKITSMKEQLEIQTEHQWRDRMYYAALRYVLGITEDFEPDDLQLDL